MPVTGLRVAFAACLYHIRRRSAVNRQANVRVLNRPFVAVARELSADHRIDLQLPFTQ